MTTGRRDETRTDARDEELSGRLVAGDPAALAEAYRWHGATVHGFVRRLLPTDPGAAEDVLHDVFLRLWARPTDYDPARGRLLAWLCTVARRRAVDRMRHAEVRERYLPMLAMSQVAPPDAAEPVLRNAVRRAVRVAVKDLPEPHRTAVLLAYYQGLSYRQVAVALQIPEGTAKSRLRLGLRRLADRLAAEGILDR